MAYTLNLTFSFGAGNTGLTLNGKIFDTAGAQVGATVTSGFVELGSGGVYSYLATIPDGQVGTFVAYKSTDATIAVAVAVNPQEGEYTDAKTSGRMAAYTQPTGFLAATFPTGTIANTTNITAGTTTPPSVDGVSYADGTAALYAVSFGVATVAGPVVSYKLRDGITTKVTMTVGGLPGVRTASVLA